MISYRNDRENVAARVASGLGLTRRRVVDYCRVTTAL
jgi:hypothetical protein